MSADLMIAAGVVLGTVLFGWAVFGAVLGMEWLCKQVVKFGYRPSGCLSLKPGYRPSGCLSREQSPGQTQAGRGEG